VHIIFVMRQQPLIPSNPENDLISDLLATPPEESEFLPKAERLAGMVQERVESSESLSRYRAVRERMGKSAGTTFFAPCYPITVHST